MTVDLDLVDFISLVQGTKPSMNLCCTLQKEGIMRFSGNQWNPDWGFLPDVLNKMTEIELFELYKRIKK